MASRPDRPLVAEARHAAGLTQQQFADRLDVDQAVLAKWETGKREPRVYAAVRLSEVLGKTANELWPTRKRA
jgi:transcriptional regulator with XRE-family HTH domain